MQYNVLIKEENIVGGFVVRFFFFFFNVFLYLLLQSYSSVLIRERFCVNFFVCSLLVEPGE